MNKIKIGWSEVSIVPEGRKVDLVGQFYERISDVVETPIAVTALAMDTRCFFDTIFSVLRSDGVVEGAASVGEKEAEKEMSVK